MYNRIFPGCQEGPLGFFPSLRPEKQLNKIIFYG
jgi:hypothetical protein